MISLLCRFYTVDSFYYCIFFSLNYIWINLYNKNHLFILIYPDSITQSSEIKGPRFFSLYQDKKVYLDISYFIEIKLPCFFSLYQDRPIQIGFSLLNSLDIRCLGSGIRLYPIWTWSYRLASFKRTLCPFK